MHLPSEKWRFSKSKEFIMVDSIVFSKGLKISCDELNSVQSYNEQRVDKSEISITLIMYLVVIME